MIAGVYWSRIVGPIVGIAVFLTIFRIGGGYRGLILGMAAFGFCAWLGERYWARQASTEEKRLALEDRVRNPLE